MGKLRVEIDPNSKPDFISHPPQDLGDSIQPLVFPCHVKWGDNDTDAMGSLQGPSVEHR